MVLGKTTIMNIINGFWSILDKLFCKSICMAFFISNNNLQDELTIESILHQIMKLLKSQPTKKR
jgi:hypothetical protein